VCYDGRTALHDVSFTLGAGGRLAVVGPNGAGKSTLFRAVAGLERPTAGHITVHGHLPGTGQCVAYVPQRSDVDWRFPVTVADVVMMSRTGQIGLLRRPTAADRTAVEEAIALMGLASLADRQIGELSGGEQQRAVLARALAQRAELVLMDEPLTGLDARAHADILGVLDRLRDDGVAVLVATHDLDLAAEHFDRVMLLRERIVGLGGPEEVFTPANLVAAYGGSVRVLGSGDDTVAVSDAGCEGCHGHG
jgi:ABC-type Mn2+/Zn2+ transport system ATPase subunit